MSIIETALPPLTDTLPGKTSIERIAGALRTAVLQGKLPPGHRLRIDELRNHFGVSASTVREAVSRLLSEDLVTTEGQKGFQVAAASLEDFRQIAEMRKLVEIEAVRQSILRGDDAWEGRVVSAAHQLQKVEAILPGREGELFPQWERCNRAFHNALVSGCGNDWMLRTRATLYSHSIRYLHIALVESTVPRDVSAEHAAILETTLARDASHACAILAEHIQKSVDVTAEKLEALDSDVLS